MARRRGVALHERSSLTHINRRRGLPPHHRSIPSDPEMPMKILLPVDGSDYTKRTLAYIAAHDELLGAGHEFTVLTVVPAVPAHAARFLDRAMLDGYYVEEAEEVLRPVKRFAEQQGWKVRAVQLQGHAAETIAAFAESEKADLVVMGTHGHSSIGNVVLGSVANGVLARCKVPLLLIR
jgi:nucleotide-binding universal stress UspA family protein